MPNYQNESCAVMRCVGLAAFFFYGLPRSRTESCSYEHTVQHAGHAHRRGSSSSRAFAQFVGICTPVTPVSVRRRRPALHQSEQSLLAKHAEKRSGDAVVTFASQA